MIPFNSGLLKYLIDKNIFLFKNIYFINFCLSNFIVQNSINILMFFF